MADKQSELERIYTIPLRHAKMGTRSKRANRAVGDVRTFLTRHMKSEQIWLDNDVNEALWANGKFNIKSRIRVRATRFSDGVVEVTLPESTTTGSVRDEIQERREKAAATPVLTAPEEEHEHVAGDDRSVTDVAGIGPATAEKLEKAEIETVADLAAADAATVATAIGSNVETVKGWIAAAQDLQSLEADDDHGDHDHHDGDQEDDEPEGNDDGDDSGDGNDGDLGGKVAVAASADAKPAKPADAKPADAKPADAKPADAKPADAKPAKPAKKEADADSDVEE